MEPNGRSRWIETVPPVTLRPDELTARHREQVLQALAERWDRYYPDRHGGRPPSIRPVDGDRPQGYSILQEYALTFDGEPRSCRIIVKLRRGSRWGAVTDGAGTSKASALAQMEYRELSRAYQYFTASGGECSVIRPLDYLEEINALVMERASGDDLGRLVTRSAMAPENQFLRCGRWLRRYHREVHSCTTRRWSADEYRTRIADRLAALRAHGVRPAALDSLATGIFGRTTRQAAREVPVSVLHGDFKLRHVWAASDKIQVLDFGNVHAGDCYEDVAAFLVELELLTLATPVTRHAVVARCAAAFLGGYLGDELRPPMLSYYLVDALLKKWLRRLKRWDHGPILSTVQGGLERLGLKRAIDRLWLDPWFLRRIGGHLPLPDTAP